MSARLRSRVESDAASCTSCGSPDAKHVLEVGHKQGATEIRFCGLCYGSFKQTVNEYRTGRPAKQKKPQAERA